MTSDILKSIGGYPFLKIVLLFNTSLLFFTFILILRDTAIGRVFSNKSTKTIEDNERITMSLRTIFLGILNIITLGIIVLGIIAIGW